MDTAWRRVLRKIDDYRWEGPISYKQGRLPFHFSLSCIGEGNGNPLQCSCLENPRDGGAWWASVCGVAQSLTRLKRLSSNSSSSWHFMSWDLNLCGKSILGDDLATYTFCLQD